MAEYCDFDSAYVFRYSPRPETPAYEMDDDVPFSVKTSRFLELESVLKSSQANALQEYIGKTVKVLAERVSSKFETDLFGHSSCQKIVNFTAPAEMLGRIVDVRITEAKTNGLFGQICNN